MHSVIQHILVRKNKAVPVDDSRKIALVLYGGLMRGINGAGALKALQEIGLGKAFDEIYAISAGFPNACYFLSEDGKTEGSKGMSIYYEDLIKKDFINYCRFWKIVDVEYPIEMMKTKKKLGIDSILQSTTKLFVALWDKKSKKVDYLDMQKFPKHRFFEIMKACTSIPYLHPGSVNIDGVKYMDLPITVSKKPYYNHAIYPISKGATDVLVIYNYPNQGLENNFPENVFIINPPSQVKLNRFETNKDKLIMAGKKMAQFTKEQFGEKGFIKIHISKE